MSSVNSQISISATLEKRKENVSTKKKEIVKILKSTRQPYGFVNKLPLLLLRGFLFHWKN